MNAPERGLLLLCCPLPGDQVKPLSLSQFQTLSLRVRSTGKPSGDPARELTAEDLRDLGYDLMTAERICALLDRQVQLDRYLLQAERYGVRVITRLDAAYPARLRSRLGFDCPPVLFAAGNIDLLQTRCVAVVGSRKLLPYGRAFASRIGSLAAAEETTLVSGNAVGADQTAQNACRREGGNVIAFVADELLRHSGEAGERFVLLSEDGFDLPFSTPRALRRNRLIYAMAEKSFVAQCEEGRGGTWSGAAENLRHGWSELYVCEDGSDGARALAARGAVPIDARAMRSLQDAQPLQRSLF